MTNSSLEPNPVGSLEFKIVAGLLGAVATFAVQRLVRAGWKQITGQEPPDPDDPEATTMSAVAWVAASAVGVAVAQVATRRFTARRYANLGRCRAARDTAKNSDALTKRSARIARRN